MHDRQRRRVEIDSTTLLWGTLLVNSQPLYAAPRTNLEGPVLSADQASHAEYFKPKCRRDYIPQSRRFCRFLQLNTDILNAFNLSILMEGLGRDQTSSEDIERGAERKSPEPLPAAARTEGGVLLSVDSRRRSSLRLAKDGHTVLLPQPTYDDADPLNWPSWKKHAVLLVVAWGAFCADFTSAAGSAPVFVQAQAWDKSISDLNNINSINILMLALGSLVWVPLTSIFGRAPILFWSNILGFCFSIGAAASPNYITFFAMRAITGFFITSAQTISIAVIRDLFFLHERTRKIGLWALLYITSPFAGPLVSYFVLGATGKWEDVFWVCVGVCALDVILVFGFLDETWYNRDIPYERQPRRGKGLAPRMSRIIGVWALKNQHSYFIAPLESFKRFFLMLTKPALSLILFSYLICFAWAIGINITTATLFTTPRDLGGYGYSYTSLGYLYFSPIVGVMFGEVFSNYGNEFFARRYVRKNNGVFEPEARLVMVYLSAIPMIIGLVVLGQALHRQLSPAAVILGWGMHSFGIITLSVAVASYIIDSYPTAAVEVSGWSNFARTIGGFSVGYFQQSWGAKVGYDASFGTQAAIVAFGVILVAIVHRYSYSLRIKAGPLSRTRSRPRSRVRSRPTQPWAQQPRTWSNRPIKRHHRRAKYRRHGRDKQSTRVIN